MYSNKVNLQMDSYSENESFARVMAAAFAAKLDPTLEEIDDIKTAVSEAVTNCIIHGYEGTKGKIYMNMSITDDVFYVEIIDKGIGIENITQAMEPLFTTKAEQERSGMGFAFMEAFMDELEVISHTGEGTCVKMKKKIGGVKPEE